MLLMASHNERPIIRLDGLPEPALLLLSFTHVCSQGHVVCEGVNHQLFEIWDTHSSDHDDYCLMRWHHVALQIGISFYKNYCLYLWANRLSWRWKQHFPLQCWNLSTYIASHPRWQHPQPSSVYCTYSLTITLL